MEHGNPLGEERIIKLLARFSVPAIVGMMVNALYNIVDRIFIGNSDYLGNNGLAAATVCFPIMIIVLAVGLLFGIGGQPCFPLDWVKAGKRMLKEFLAMPLFFWFSAALSFQYWVLLS